MNKFTPILFLILLVSVFFGTVFVSSSEAQQYGVLTIEPTSGTIKQGETQTVKVSLTSGAKISAFDLVLQTNEFLEVSEVEPVIETTPSLSPFEYKKVMDSAQNSGHRVAYIFTSKYANLADVTAIFVKIKGLKDGGGTLSIDLQSSKVLDGFGKPLELVPVKSTFTVSRNESIGNFVAQASLPQVSYPSTSAVVKLKTKLYGVTDLTAKVRATAVAVGRIGEGKYETQLQTFDFIGNGDGTYSGTVAFPDFKDGNKYSLMIKADHFLLKRICDTNPQEQSLGDYRCQTPSLTIKYGEENIFDFSGISLIPGDLGMTDNVLNGYDLSIVRNNLGKTERAALDLADITYDGLIDKKDLAVIYFAARTTSRRGDK